MIFFTCDTACDSGYGARIFIQRHTNADETNEVIGIHELAKELSVWRGADKNVTFPAQQDKTKPGLHMRFKTPVELSGYEVEAEEMAVLVKRCTRRKLKNITADLKNIEQVWQ